MATMPKVLTTICDSIDSSKYLMAVWAVNARNVPMQNISNECSPHLRSGSRIRHLRKGALNGTNTLTSQANARK
jgi:hypothetical protein